MKPTRPKGKSCRHLKSLAIFLAAVFLGMPVVAQRPAPPPQSVITIDGAVEPERIPDWILWREFFRIATELSQSSPTRGKELWTERLLMTDPQAEHIIAHGVSFSLDERKMDENAASLRRGAGANMPDSVKTRLRQIQIDKESRILAIRDQLRNRIGADAINRMQSFARVNLAPTIKVGKLEWNRH
jgi:hypothetical protein